MGQQDEQTRRVVSSIWRKVGFFLGPYVIGFMISCAVMGSRFRVGDAALVTVVIGTLLLLCVLMILLAKRTIQGAGGLYRGTTLPSTFVKMMVVGPIITILITLGLVWSVHSRQERCDKAAEADLKKLSATVERLGNELKDLGCTDLKKQFAEEHIKYLVGPYYGWRGTNGPCKVLVRIEKGELQSCTLRGSRPADNREHRRIFRSALFGSQQLDPIVGECKGKSYGYFPDHLYFSTMVVGKNGHCELHEPIVPEKFKPYGYDDYQRELSKQRQK